MEDKLIYFDNAATSFPKPELVYRENDAVLRTTGNPGRGGHRLSLNSARTIFDARTALANFLGLPESRAERLIFTPGCTQSINIVLRSINFQRNDVVLVSALEHNAVMRPLHRLQKNIGIKIQGLPYAAHNIIDPAQLKDCLQSVRPRLCVFMEASNVSGEKLQLETIAEICQAAGVELLIDAAQTAGTKCDTLKSDGITYWAAPGHKHMLGSPGVGLLYCNSDTVLEPLVCGGTGSASEQLDMPVHLPDRLEAGTLPVPAIASLMAGVRFVQEVGADHRNKHESHLAQSLREWCRSRDWITVAGNTFNGRKYSEEDACAAVVSFSMKDLSADRIADALDSDYGIAVRAGLHCAARAHETLGTSAQGLVRVSFGFFNTLDELSQLYTALEELHNRISR